VHRLFAEQVRLEFSVGEKCFLPNGEKNRILFFCIRVYCSQKYITLKDVISKFYVSDHIIKIEEMFKQRMLQTM